ncbi:MAG: fumarylacetoacetate hydrolase family protein, partial [Gemmatimonadales bacterium]|nr:fumarylacetoacetate hydrolase family protein [Gemmatimonadales bacterium]
LGNVVPERPLLFLKPPSALIGPDAAIVVPRESTQVEHEGEIGVVLGARLRKAREADALDAVAGIVCVNDVTARDLQKSDPQWTRAKGFDTFCPAGPAVVSLDRLPPWRELEVICRVNGAERQHGHASDMMFGIPFLLAYISHVMTLEPGDLMLTGSPSGVGPLMPGDVVEVEIPGVGILRNPVTGPDT